MNQIFENFSFYGRYIATFSFLIALLFVNIFPFDLFFPTNALSVWPDFFLIAFFYGLLYRPDLLRMSHVFLIGLLCDGIYGYPLGTSSLHYLITAAFLLPQRSLLLPQAFPMVWFSFSGFVMFNFTLKWLILSYLQTEWIWGWYRIPGLVLTILLYPCCGVFLRKCEGYFDR